MGAIATTAGSSGPRSATFTVPTSNGSDTVSNAELLDVCSEGPLKDLLAGPVGGYADAAAFGYWQSSDAMKVDSIRNSGFFTA